MPRCEDGRRGRPPEDVGGPHGYNGLLAALDDLDAAPDDLLQVVETLIDVDPAACSGEATTSLLQARL